MAKLQPVRGTHDLFPDDMRRHRAVVDPARDVAALYGFEEIATPVFEFTEVFRRPLGDTSDIVTKEMYTFAMRDGTEVTLRPENTASVVRAVLSAGVLQEAPLKYFYAGPMFRYERPQKGRQRQFHQIGVELIGVAQPQADIEVIAVGAHVLERIGVLDRTVLELNTLGDVESRQAYRTALVEYFNDRRGDLSEDSLSRLERNPLRILDSKDSGDRAVVADAPAFDDYLNDESRDFFAAVTTGLDTLGIAYRRNNRLVRGLDYYCHTAFEFTTEALGAQGTVMGGGRYDGLTELLGGPQTPGVGWAAGIERLAMLVQDVPAPARPIAVMPVGATAEVAALKVTQDLRHAGLTVDLGYSGNLGRRMKRANRLQAAWAVILGEDELARGAATLRNLDSGEQREIRIADLTTELTAGPATGAAVPAD